MYRELDSLAINFYYASTFYGVEGKGRETVIRKWHGVFDRYLVSISTRGPTLWLGILYLFLINLPDGTVSTISRRGMELLSELMYEVE